MALPKSTYSQEVITDAWLNEIAKLVASMNSVDVAGTGTYTLSATEYQCRVLVLTGVLTGARSIVTPGEAGRAWIVFNNTSGAFSVTVKTSGGTGIVITQGKSGVVYDDGVNVSSGFTDLVGAGIAGSGANSDITSMTGLTGAIGKPTQINDTNGNEVIKFAAGVASAVNETSFTNAATGNGPLVEATGGDTNIDVTLRGKGSGGVQLSRSGGKLGFFGVAVASRAAALVQTYATADRTLSAYTPDPETSAYTGAADSEAKLADLNALRVATENLRLFTEDLAQLVNAIVDDLQLYGLES